MLSHCILVNVRVALSGRRRFKETKDPSRNLFQSIGPSVAELHSQHVCKQVWVFSKVLHALNNELRQLTCFCENVKRFTLPSFILIDNQRKSGVHVRHVWLRRPGRNFLRWIGHLHLHRDWSTLKGETDSFHRAKSTNAVTRWNRNPRAYTLL